MSGEERNKTRILLADGHRLVRQGIRRIFEAEPDLLVVGEADNGERAVRLARQFKPDVIVMEARMGKLNSVEAIRQVKAEHREAAVLVLTAYDDEEYIVALIAVGADGYLPKNADSEELVQAVRSVRAGRFVCDPALAHNVFRRVAHLSLPVNSAEHLTDRELEVLRLLARGLGNRDIAAQLGVGERTVKGHVMNVCAKLGVRSRTEAVVEALKRGLVKVENDSGVGESP